MECTYIWPSPVSPVDILTLAINALPGKYGPCGVMGYEKNCTPSFAHACVR